jgi:MFS family permease
MSDTSAASLVIGLLLLAILVWGLVTGKMLARYTVEDRNLNPRWFWLSAAFNAAFALVCFYVTWADW